MLNSDYSRRELIKLFEVDQPNKDKPIRHIPAKSNKKQPRSMYFYAIYSTFFLLFATWMFIIFFFAPNILSSPNAVYYKEVQPLFDDYEPSAANETCTPYIFDFYDGALATLYRIIERNQITMIYLYAHWCARSRAYRGLIRQLACKHSNEMSVLAVNCFNRDGECKRNFNFVKFPNVIFHIRELGFFSYNGPMEINYLSNYIEQIQRPIKVIESFDQFMDSVLFNDGMIVAKFDFKNNTDTAIYKTYYHTALNSLTQEYPNPSKFGIVLNDQLWQRLLDLDQSVKSDVKKRVKLMGFSSQGVSSVYKKMSNITVENLLSWSTKTTSPAIHWYYPDRYKNTGLSGKKLLIFVPRELEEKSISFEYVYATLKYLNLKQKQKSYHPSRNSKVFSFYLKHLEASFLNKSCLNDHIYFDSFAFDLTSRYKPTQQQQQHHMSYPVKDKTYSHFVANDIAFVDYNLYKNYANRLVNGSKVDQNGPITMLIDYRNESVYLFHERFNYENLNSFIRSHHSLANKRFMKTQQIERDSRVHNFQDINLTDLESIFNNHIDSEFRDKDLLIFFYNNWCGFCKLVQFNLVSLVNSYMKSVESFRILKFNVDLNDMPWSLKVSRVPTLLFLPSSFSNKTRDSLVYGQDYEATSLLNFVLFNSHNPNTLIDFIRSQTKQSSLVDKEIGEIVSKKVIELRRQVDQLNRHVHALDLNTTISQRLSHIQLLNTFLLALNKN